MSRHAKSGFSREVVDWVHSGGVSESGKSWVIRGKGGGTFVGPLRGTAEREGRTVPIFNLERRGYWGAFSDGRDDSTFHRHQTLREAIGLAHAEWQRLAVERRSDSANRRDERPDTEVVKERAKGMQQVEVCHEVERRRTAKKAEQTVSPVSAMERPWKKRIWTQGDFG